MKFPPPNNVSSFHNDILQETVLGQLCGQKKLFRNRYVILKMLGRGGFGVTFLARDISLPGHPLCVIKQLCPKVVSEEALLNARKRFHREAKILSVLGSHSQIPMLLDYFVIGDDFYLVQEYIQGMTLARLVRRYGCQPEISVKRFLRQMLPLLTYIHSQGVIHRDIKPQNIIRSKSDGRLVLIDFGAVKEQITLAAEESKCMTTHFVGTVGFAPPEQFSLRPVFASDLYALGVTCLYLLSGQGPLEFDCDRRTGELEWAANLKISDSFAEILGRLLKVSLKDRFQSASEILKALNDESPQDNLAQCMTVQHQPQKTYNRRQPKPESNPDNPPFAKAAQAIRHWKNCLQRKKNVGRSDRPIEKLLTSSGTSA